MRAKRLPRFRWALRTSKKELRGDMDFWRWVRRSAGCWEWIGCKRDGYGRLQRDGRDTTAHREMWRIIHGEDPGKLHVLHTCDNPACVRPDHLFLGTAADNVIDMISKDRHWRRPGCYVGVIQPTRSRRFEARITVRRKITLLGRFDTPEEAAREYDRAARAVYGAKARLNFPDKS